MSILEEPARPLLWDLPPVSPRSGLQGPLNCEGWAGSSDCKQEVVISGFELSENLKVLSQETSSEMHFLCEERQDRCPWTSREGLPGGVWLQA